MTLFFYFLSQPIKLNALSIGIRKVKKNLILRLYIFLVCVGGGGGEGGKLRVCITFHPFN